ncbi:RNA-binding protein 33-like [Polypterus senegalus]|uniref:RNA-binding protein 33-like n=1 Tax=Polypterus senegalus TaxID=55291 RepID=UPI0019629D03|nr:RNA-binding protein 33-like [Polypterus senegalus]
MAASGKDDEFDQFDKPGAERSRRRRTGDEDFDSDLEYELLDDDWLSSKKNQSDLSDEELNDDLLQSDEEDQNISSEGVVVSLNATTGLVSSFDYGKSDNEQVLEDSSYEQEGNDNLTVENYEGGEDLEGEESYSQDVYAEHYEIDDADLEENQLGYLAEQAEEEIYNDEVLDIEINDPLDDEFQEDDYSQAYTEQSSALLDHCDAMQEEVEENLQHAESRFEAEEGEKEAEQDYQGKDESDEEDEDDGESERLRFKTERKDATVIRLSDAATKRRNIPETLELSEEAKAALQEFEEKEKQRKQGRLGGRIRGRGRGRGNFFFYGPSTLRKDVGDRGRLNEHRPPLMPLPLPMQHHHPRMPHQYHLQNFQERELQRPPVQPLIHSHPPHRSSPTQATHTRPQGDGSRIMSPPQSAHSPKQPKNIHINPHFRGPVSSSMQVPLMPVQSQPRPAVVPQRFPGAPEFQPHVPVNFNQPPRHHHPEPWRPPPPPPPPPPSAPTQERDPFFIGDQRFPGQHIYDQNPPSLMSNNHTTPGPAPMAFNQPGPGFHQQGQPSIFQREGPIRSNLHPSGPMGLPHFSQPGMATPRPFIPHRQQFPQGPSQPFPPPHLQLGMQVRHRGPMQPPNPLPPSPHSQPQHHEPQNSPHHPPHSHSQQQPLHLQHQLHHHHSNQPGPLRARLLNMQPPFRPQLQNIQQQKPPRMQRPIQRTGTIRPRLSAPPQNVNKLQNQQVQAMPQRNSNLRELPEAPANVNLNSSRPIPTPAVLEKPVTRLMQNARAESSKALLVSNSLPGSVAQSEPVVAARCVEHKVEKETPSSQPDPPPKAEEATLWREEVLRRKEFRRQMQAGKRKKELMERMSTQQQLLPALASVLPLPDKQVQQTNLLQAPTNGIHQPPQVTAIAAPSKPNIKNRLQMKNQSPIIPNMQQNTRPIQGNPNLQIQRQQRKNVLQSTPAQNSQTQNKALSLMSGIEKSQSTHGVAGQSRPQESRLSMKRTVMQRSNNMGSVDDQHGTQKVRVFTAFGGGPETVLEANPVMQSPRFQQFQQQRQQSGRKVTLGKTAFQQQLMPSRPQNFIQGVRNNSGNQSQIRAITQGRGRAVSGQMGRGRLMPNKQSPQVAEPQPCIVSIEGLSSSTTDVQLKNLLMSVGPIQMFQLFPEQRKAIAKFKNPQHALTFQQRFHRHMIDLSHINVSLNAG